MLWCIILCLPLLANAKKLTTVAAPPVNDDCANAITITPGNTYSGTTIDATDDSAPFVSCVGTGVSRTVWYRFIGTGDPMTLSTCNSGTDFDTEINVLTKPIPEFPVDICGFYTCIAGNDNGPGISNPACYDGLGRNLFSVIDEFDTVLGQEYLIRVATGSVTPAGGNFDLEFYEVGVAPVELVDIWGDTYENGNTIAWETSSEENVLWHIIERSKDGESGWSEVGKLVSGTSAANGAFYEMEDKEPFNLSYYRLRTVDYDGSEQVSNVISVKRERPEFDIISIYPNPISSGTVTFKVESEKEESIRIRVMDLAGKNVERFEFDVREGLNEMLVDVSSYRSGVYFVQFESRQGYYTKKIFKQE